MPGTTYTVNLKDGVSGEAKKISRSLGGVSDAVQKMQAFGKSFGQRPAWQSWRKPTEEVKASVHDLSGGIQELGGPLGGVAGKVEQFGGVLSKLGPMAVPIAAIGVAIIGVGVAAGVAAMAFGALLKAGDATSALYRTALVAGKAWGKTGDELDAFADGAVDSFLRVQRETLGATDELQERFGKMSAARIGGQLGEDLVRVSTNMQALTKEGDEWIDKIVDMRNEISQGIVSGQGAKVSDAFFEDVGGKMGSVQELWAEWSKVTGKSVDELKKLQATSKVTLKDADGLAQAAANLGKKFDGAALAGKSFGEIVSGGIHNLMQEAGTMVNVDRFTQPLGEFLRSDKAVGFARAVGAAFDGVLDTVESFVGGMRTGFDMFKGPLKAALTSLTGAFADLGSAMGGDSGAGSMGEKFGAGLTVMAAQIIGSIAAIIRFGLAVYAGVSIAGQKIQQFSDTVHSVIDPIGDFMVNAGTQIGQGLANGLDAGIGVAVAAAKRLAAQVKAVVPAAFLIASPSRFMSKMGGFVTEGFAEGITGGTSDVEKATASTFDPGSIESGLTKNFSAMTGGSKSASIVINVEGGDAADTARAVRLELSTYLEGLGFESATPVAA